MKQPISQAQKLEYAYNCQIRIENTKVSKTVKIFSVSITELIAGETLRKIQLGSASYFAPSLFHCMPSFYLKGYQPDSFPYGFHMVWTVFRHSFSFLFWKMSKNDHIASVDGWVPAEFCMCQQLGADIFSLSPIKKATVRLKYYRLFIVKTTWGLIIKNVWHVSKNFTDTIWNFCLPVVTCTSLWNTEQNAQPNGGFWI